MGWAIGCGVTGFVSAKKEDIKLCLRCNKPSNAHLQLPLEGELQGAET